MALETALPKGSLILITGVNGFIATPIAQQLLTRGYRVRGTVRNATKSKWLVDDLFRSEASNGTFELVTVEDMASEGAFREAVRGVDAIAHVATITSLDPDPNNVVHQTVAGVVNLLEVASEEPSVKAVVLTSSVGAAAMPVPDTPLHVDEHSWNDAAVSMAWAPPPYEPERALVTYMASKVESEKALWKFVEERKPHFRTNTILPFTVLGALLHPQQNASTTGWALALYGGNTEFTELMKASYSIHVEDIALLHVAAILDSSVKNERIHAWSDEFIWNDVLAIFRKLRPDQKFVDDLPDVPRMKATVDDKVTWSLLKKWGNQEGPLGLERSIKDTIEGKRPSSG